MASVSTWRLDSLERWSPTLFLVGGGLVVGHAAIRGIDAFTDLAAPPDVFAPAGYLLALLGLFGLYPALVDRTPRVARAAVSVAAVPLVGWVVIAASSIGEVAGVLAAQSGVLPGAFFGVHMVTLILTYVLFGVASLRTDVHSRSVGLLLLVTPVLFVAMVAGAAIAGNSATGAFVVGGALALVHLAIGSVLRAGVPTDGEVPAGDVTTG